MCTHPGSDARSAALGANLHTVPSAGGKKKSLNVGSKGGSAGLEDYVYSDDGGESCSVSIHIRGALHGSWMPRRLRKHILHAAQPEALDWT